jgi:putative FmdB family regulatory protein
MPTYGYICTECDHEFEVFQSITAPPVTKCERCGSKVRKQVFPVGIAFKGSGFHVNDYSSSHNGSSSSDAPACEAAKNGSCPEAKT